MTKVASAPSTADDGLAYGITPEQAGSIAGLFLERVRRTPRAVAYRHFDPGQEKWVDLTWAEMAERVTRWQIALTGEGLKAGDRVALMLPDGPDWIAADVAIQTLGLVTVGLFRDDTPGNTAHMLAHSRAQVLIVSAPRQWLSLRDTNIGRSNCLASLARIVSLAPVPRGNVDDRIVGFEDWLQRGGAIPPPRDIDPDGLATLVYTSGTVGRAKAVMLTQSNLLHNAYACFRAIPQRPDDVQLSFLPLAHAFERVTGYYHGMLAGSTMAFNRSVPQLQEDLLAIRPTILISVPRIFERIYGRIRNELDSSAGTGRGLFQLAVEVGWSRFLYRQGRGTWHSRHILWPMLEQLVARKVVDRFGGRLRVAISGGAALSPQLARTFIGLGIPLLQGYGLTEAGPVVSSNRLEDNEPASVGVPIDGVSVKVAATNELLVKGPGVMLGYWQDEASTRNAIDSGGWLHTGDKVSRLDQKRIYLTGRLKEIIVMSNGEKASPSDIESTLRALPLIDQVIVVGEARPYLSALVVCDADALEHLMQDLQLVPGPSESYADPALEGALLQSFTQALQDFPRYSQIRRVAVLRQPWTVESGLLNVSLKVKRKLVGKRFATEIARLYEGHFHVEKTDFSQNVDVG